MQKPRVKCYLIGYFSYYTMDGIIYRVYNEYPPKNWNDLKQYDTPVPWVGY